jgi:NAD(P)-dependent dehydrogenase (short-subunit alcohol dehydrogenase family)
VLISGDLQEARHCREVIQKAVDELGGIDILVNNAGIHVPGAAVDVPSSDWNLVQDVNVRSAFLLARGLAPRMIKNGWGKIVNVSSVLGSVGDVDSAAYVTSKAALLGLTRALGTEWARHGVTVNALCPGWTTTDMVDELHRLESFDRRVRDRTPARRWGTPDDLAGAIVFLSSPASDFMVGQALVIDGGLSASW